MRALLKTLLILLLRRTTSLSSVSSVAVLTSLTSGAWCHRGRRNVRSARERSTHRSHKYLVTLREVEVRIGEESLASIFPGQRNDCMMEHIEGETLSEVLLEVRPEEVIPSLEEIPSMVELNAPQLGEVVPHILGTESVVDAGYRKDESHANNELVVPAGDEG